MPINFSESSAISSYKPSYDYMSSPTISGAIGDPYGNTPSDYLTSTHVESEKPEINSEPAEPDSEKSGHAHI